MCTRGDSDGDILNVRTGVCVCPYMWRVFVGAVSLGVLRVCVSRDLFVYVCVYKCDNFFSVPVV